jgi:hypothetical protein
MADNVTLNSGTGGATLATDDVTDAGGAHYQRVKLTDGTANSETHIQADGGTEANALRVTIANDSTGLLSVDDNGNSLTIDNTNIDNLHSEDYDTGAGTDTTTAIGLAIPSNSGAVAVDSTNPLPIDVQFGSSQAATNTGNSNANTQRVVLASDQPVVSVDDNGGSLTVDGTVTANLSATDNAVLDQIDANTDYGAVTGGGTETGALRVTIANDSTGVLSVDDGGSTLSIDDGGGAITVDGTVTANLSATDNAVLDNIDTNTTRSSSHYRNIDANAEDSIKGSAGTLHWIHAMNLTAAKAYLHLYDATTANVTPGTTTPDFTFPIPTQGDTNGAGFNLRLEHEFANAITLVVTTTTDGSAGDPGTNGVMVNAGYS